MVPPTIGRDNRPVYSGPSCDIRCANDIRVGRESTPHALKLALAAAVLLVNVSADWARSTGVSRIDDTNLDTHQASLVIDKVPKLVECPSRVFRPLSLSNGCPIADALQVFQSETTVGAFALGYERFRDAMVLNLPKTGLPPCDIAQPAPGAACPMPLEACTKVRVSLPDRFYGISRVSFAIRVGGEVPDPEVNTKPVDWFNWSTVRYLDGHEQEELPLAVHQIGLSASATKPGAVVISHDDWQDQAAVKRRKAHTIDTVFEGVEPLVERNGSMRPEVRELGLVSLVDLADLRNHTNRVLRMKPKALTKISVVQMLKLDLVGRSQRERTFGEPVAGGVNTFERGEQLGPLIGRHYQLARGYEFHWYNHTRSKQEHKQKTERFLLVLKDEASALETR